MFKINCNIFLSGVFGQKGVQNEFFSFVTNQCIEFLLFFCIKLQQPKGWKLSQIILAECLFWVFGARRPQNGLKMRFSKFYGDLKYVWLICCYNVYVTNKCVFFGGGRGVRAKTVLISHDQKLVFLV